MKKMALLTLAVFALSVLGGGLHAGLKNWKEMNDQVIKLYQEGRAAEAMPLAEEVLKTAEAQYAEDSPEVALSLNNLALLQKGQQKYDEALKLYQRSLKIAEKITEPDNQRVIVALNNIALTYEAMGNPAEADKIYKRVRELGYKEEADIMKDRASGLRVK